MTKKYKCLLLIFIVLGIFAVILSPAKDRYDCVIYYECENITDVNRISADDYTMFLLKNDGTLWYWMSDKVKYHDHDNYFSSCADDGLEHGKGQFESVDIAEIMNIQENSPKPEIVDMCSNIENTLFSIIYSIRIEAANGCML